MATTVVLEDVVEVSPDKMSGAPVFRGTRVLVQTLLDYLEAGDSLDVFLADFPTVNRDQAVRFVELAGKAALAPLRKPDGRGRGRETGRGTGTGRGAASGRRPPLLRPGG